MAADEYARPRRYGLKTGPRDAARTVIGSDGTGAPLNYVDGVPVPDPLYLHRRRLVVTSVALGTPERTGGG